MNNQLKLQIIRFAKSLLLIMLILSVLSISYYGQNIEYNFRGRVLDDIGNPIKGAGVVIHSNNNFCHMFEHSITDGDGRFEHSFIGRKEEKYFLSVSKLFLSEIIKENVGFKQLISTPFKCDGLKSEKYIGKPINIERSSLINLGDVKVQYWYAPVYPKLTINGNKLTKDQWLKLWISLKDENGKTVVGESIGPTLEDNEIDLEKSILRFLLPEGKWKLEFQLFDNEELIIHPEIIGETPFFTIDKNVEPEIIEVKIKKEYCKRL